MLLAFLLLALSGCNVTRPVETAPAPVVHLDTSGARDLLDFCRAIKENRPYNEAAIRRLAATPPYQVLLAHHGAIDPTINLEALVEVLLAVRDGKKLAGKSPRLTRIYASYHAALDMLPTLEERLQAFSDPALLERTTAQVQAALPPQARLQTTVYLLADGYSPAYLADDAIVLDLLQIGKPDGLERRLAHELHLAATSTLLPGPCSDPSLGRGLGILAGLVQEGAATYWVDGWRAKPAADDYTQVAAFLADAVAGKQPANEAKARLAGLLLNGEGALYRVGNGMIAGLVAAHGDAWVQARLGDPVGLLRAYRKLGEWPASQEVLALMEKEHKCPAWTASRR